MNPLLKTPSTDFNAVRDGRNSLPLYIDIDLSSARDKAANTQLVIGIAGNSFYADADTTNGGNAVVTFQDTNLGESGAPFFISPGFIANVGFTQLLIENTAQAGKRLRIFYGVDIDFQAGVNSSIAISGTVQISNTLAQKIPMYLAGYDYGASYKSTSAMLANTPEIIFTPAANANGAILHTAAFFSIVATGNPSLMNLVAKNAAPANVLDGDIILSPTAMGLGGSNWASGQLINPVKIPSGKGLYAISNIAELGAQMRSALYTLL